MKIPLIPYVICFDDLVPKWISNQIWKHDKLGDWYDSFNGKSYGFFQNLKYIRCFFIGHKLEQMPPDPNGFDGEWHTYCDRCEGECPDPSWAYDTGYVVELPFMIKEVFWTLKWKLGLVKNEDDETLKG